jgi:hypothetical protein
MEGYSVDIVLIIVSRGPPILNLSGPDTWVTFRS